MDGLQWMRATDAAKAIRDGELGAEDLMNACLGQIESRDDDVGAWAFIDRDHALDQARRAD
ncbi:MAG: amidase, partial [Pseudomonadota bacterium]